MKKYNDIEIEIITFQNEDIITGSGVETTPTDFELEE